MCLHLRSQEYMALWKYYYVRRRNWAMFLGLLFVCLFVCLSTSLLKKFWTDFDDINGGVGRSVSLLVTMTWW